MPTVNPYRPTVLDADDWLDFYLDSDELVSKHFSAVLEQDLAVLFDDMEITEDGWTW